MRPRPGSRALALLAWLALAPGAAVGQSTTAHQGVGAAEPFLYESWTVRDGLPVDAVTRVLQGRRGYLWLATWDGLVRFDGARFTVFTTALSEALPSNRIVELHDAPDGSLWLRTEQSHLVRLRHGEFTHFGRADGVADRSTRTIYIDAGGQVWVGTDEGVRRLAGERLVAVAGDAIRGPVDVLLREPGGTLWVGTHASGLYRVRGHEVTHFDSAGALGSNQVTALLRDRRGAVWIGTAAGVARYRGGELGRVLPRGARGRVARHVRDLREAPLTGEIWVAFEDGLYVAGDSELRPIHDVPGQPINPSVRFDPQGVVWYALGDRLYRDGHPVFRIPYDRIEQGAPRHIEDFTWDREGSLWIGTHNSGLFRVRPPLFHVFSMAEGLPGANVASVLEDRAGDIWVGTQGGGLARVAAGKVTSYPPRLGFPSYVYALLQDSRGALWLGTLGLGALYCRLPAMVCSVPPGGQPAPGATVYALFQDAAGDVWAGTDAGLFRLHGGAWERMAQELGLQSSVVRAFLETPDGTLLMGTNGVGLVTYRAGRFSRIEAPDGLPSDLIRSLYLDGRGNLWLGTEGRGLARITLAADRAGRVSASRIRAVRQRDGLFDEVIHQILEDRFGRLWMSTNRGIFWVPLEELEAFADGRIARVHSTAYTERDGLRSREANGGHFPAGIRARDGSLWFATQDGAVVIDPAHIQRNELAPPVVVEQLAAGKRVLAAGAGAIALGVGERNFEIEYTALSFTAPENVRFRYRLEGLTPEWTDAGNRRTAYYTNVPPGHYTFHVIASNNDGVWNRTGASLALTVAPHLYETTAAKILMAFALALLGVGAVQWRLRGLRARERQLSRLVQLRTGLLQRRERQLETQNAQLATQTAQLAELNEARSRLFSNLSHEFRTPLTLILGPLRSLLEGRHGALAPGAREQAELMMRNGERLHRLVNHVLDLARLQARQLVLAPRRSDLVGFARTTTLAFAPLAERRGIALRFRSEPRALILSFDPEQLEKVLLNLLSNALKFTEPAGNVEVSVHAGNAAAEIVVRDSGVGIAPGQLPHVFDRFYQADAASTRRYEGTGIGLALAKELVELHGGEIRAESTGQGSTFTVRLPVGPVEAGDTALTLDSTPALVSAGPASDPQSVAAALSNPDHPTSAAPRLEDSADSRTSVLVIDDNADIRAYVRSILAPSYRVIEEADGRSGLERAGTSLPDLVIADVMMPELDGLALVRALKADPMTDAIPVVLLTAQAASEHRVSGLETGADAFLVKPFEPAVLEAQLANLLAQRRRLRERFRAGDMRPPAAAPAPPSPLERRLRPLVEAHLHDPGFGPNELASAASLSYHQLYRGLREQLQTTPSRFIRTIRVECAAGLLGQRAGSVTEIAYSVGFDSLSYFSRAFRERYGSPPSDYLRPPLAHV